MPWTHSRCWSRGRRFREHCHGRVDDQRPGPAPGAAGSAGGPSCIGTLDGRLGVVGGVGHRAEHGFSANASSGPGRAGVEGLICTNPPLACAGVGPRGIFLATTAFSVAFSYHSGSLRAGAIPRGMVGLPVDFRMARVVTAKPDEKRVKLEPAIATDGTRP